MNGTSNKGAGPRGGRPAWTALALPLLIALAAGCSNHGPVNLFAPELFHHTISGPNLTFYSYGGGDQNTWITLTPTAGCGDCYSGPNESYYMSLTITVANDGGAGTYGPVYVSMTSSDCHVVWSWAGGTPTSPPPNFVTPPSTGDNVGLACSDYGGGQEILPDEQNSVVLYQGDNWSDVFDTNNSASLYYTPNPSGGITQITVPISMTIWDGLGNQYVCSFDIYVTQGYSVNLAPFESYVCPDLSSPSGSWTGQP